jgi:hypothetical protein
MWCISQPHIRQNIPTGKQSAIKTHLASTVYCIAQDSFSDTYHSYQIILVLRDFSSTTCQSVNKITRKHGNENKHFLNSNRLMRAVILKLFKTIPFSLCFFFISILACKCPLSIYLSRVYYVYDLNVV